MPAVLDTYPNFMNKVFALCQIDSTYNPNLTLDSVHNVIQVNAAWMCSLYLSVYNSSLQILGNFLEM